VHRRQEDVDTVEEIGRRKRNISFVWWIDFKQVILVPRAELEGGASEHAIDILSHITAAG
jgi:hypothetical protein